MNKKNQKTVFSDIDGTIVSQEGIDFENLSISDVNILPGVLERFQRWNSEGVHIVLTTARPESMRNVTESQMKSIGIEYNQLVMGIGRGSRYLINNTSSKNPLKSRSIGIPVFKDRGFTNETVDNYGI